MLTFQNVPEATFELPGLQVQAEDNGAGIAKFDLSFSLGGLRSAGGEPEESAV